MKRLIIRYKNSHTLLQYLVYGLIIKLVYFFKRDLLHRQVELLELNIAGDQWCQIHAIKEKVAKSIIESQNKGISRPELSLFVIGANNYCISDDIYLWYKELDPNASLFFQPTFVLAELNQSKELQNTELLYDIKLFVAGQASVKLNNLSMRLYYSNLLKRLEESNNRNTMIQDDPVRLFFKLYVPSIGDILKLTKSALSGKISHHSLIKRVGLSVDSNQIINPVEVNPSKWQNVIITGWYGTETNGDKAIIGELVHFIKTCSPNCRITITSICPMVSYQTNKELTDLSDAKIVELKEAANPSIISETDSVIIGGGPLMDSSSLSHILSLFTEAYNQNKPRIIFGCGIGPIRKEETSVIVKKILELTTAGFLRDQESHAFATMLYPKHVLKWACDPAFGYIYRWRKFNSVSITKGSQLKIAGLLRAITGEFRSGFDNLKIEEENNIAASHIAHLAESACQKNKGNFELLQMNAPWLGGDDRKFNRKIESSFQNQEQVNCIREYLTLEEHLQRLQCTDVAVAMRYHGHIFCTCLGIPFLSIDYTGHKGKVNSLLKRIDYLDYSQSWDNINEEIAVERLNKLISNRKEICEELLKKSELLVNALYNTYSEVFGLIVMKG